MEEREDSLGAYDIGVALRKSHSGERTTRVYIRYSKRGKITKIDLPFPKNINEKDLHWKNAGAREGGSQIISYHRKGGLEYYDSKNSKIPTNLAQRLEPSVIEALKQNSE